MNATQFFQGVNALMRKWGYPVEEQEGCWSRSNGVGWAAGMPQAHTNHHFVIPMSANFEDGARNVTYGDSTLSGPKCNYYGGIDSRTGKQRLRLIATGTANHPGKGRIETYSRMMAGQAPLGWVSTSYSPVADNWTAASSRYAGTEWHHPGDASPWPDALIDLVVALNAAMCTVAGWGVNRMHMHAEHSARKIDMSWLRTQGGHELRRRTAARLAGGPGGGDWWDTVDEATARRVIKEEASNAVRDVLGRGGLVNGLYVTDVIGDMWTRGAATHSQVQKIIDSEENEYDAVIYEDQSGLWLSEGGASSPIPDPSTLAAIEHRLTAMGSKIFYWQQGDVQLPGAFGRRDPNAAIPGPDAPPPAVTYTVVAGDTFSGIAAKLGVTVDQLKAANPQVVDINQIAIGQVLNVPK